MTSAPASASGSSTPIPLKGEFGYDTWLDGSAEHTGNTGVWTQMTVDEKLGSVYLPVESPQATTTAATPPPPVTTCTAKSLVCVDLQTGKRKWHYQLVHQSPMGHGHLVSAPSHRH